MHIRAARAVWGWSLRGRPGPRCGERCAVLGGGFTGCLKRGPADWHRRGEAGGTPCAEALYGFASPSAPLWRACFLGVASPCFPLPAGSDAGLPRSRSQPLRRSHTPLYGDCQLRKCAPIGRRASPRRPPPGAWGRGGGGSRHCQEARVLVNSGHGLGGLARLQGEGLRGPRGSRGRGMLGGPRHTRSGSGRGGGR